MRKACVRLLTVVLVAATTGISNGQSVQEIARVGLSSTVTLVVYDAGGRIQGNGSGFVVAPGLVLTNHHVIENAYDVEAVLLGGEEGSWIDSLVLADPRLDLALLAFAGDIGVPLILRDSDRPEIGETIFAVGSPLGLEGTFTQGIVSGYRDLGSTQLMQISAPVSPGSSGGPVMDAEGRVVGVVVASFADGQNLNFAVPAPEVLGFLARAYGRTSSPTQRAATPAPADTQPPAPGFDCEYASTWSERAICASHRLADLDVLLNEVFDEVRERLARPAFEQLHQEQVAWLGTREACESQAEHLQEACLAEVIRERIAVLIRYE